MTDLTVIIPVWNIQDRGLARLRYSLCSISKEVSVIVVDGSENPMPKEYIPFCKYVHTPTGEFNMPFLHNKGIEMTETEWVMTTGADFLFAPDFFTMCHKHRSKKRMLHKEVGMLPQLNITEGRIKGWSFPRVRLHEFGYLANGACQYTTRRWFLDNPYDEKMKWFSGMDNLQAYKALNTGLEVYWIKESEVLHQWHKTKKFSTPQMNAQSQINWGIVNKYVKDNNLPQILGKVVGQRYQYPELETTL